MSGSCVEEQPAMAAATTPVSSITSRVDHKNPTSRCVTVVAAERLPCGTVGVAMGIVQTYRIV
jgi:hypothetical protein